MATLPDLPTRLEKAGIRHFDELIHDQAYDWLIANFKEGASEYPVNVARLMRNIVWQLKERIQKGEKEPLRELIRTFWYMYIKPTLSRAGALATEADQYAQLSDQIVAMVKEHQLLRYKDIGFRDENKNNWRLGANANVILFAEKVGHMELLFDLQAKYGVTVMALGGQPSVLTTEYFVDAMKEAHINLQRSFYLFSIVDYDPSGWIIQQAFLNNLAFYGVKNVRLAELVNPDQLTGEEIIFSRYAIPAGNDMTLKNETWLRQVHARKFKNQNLLEEHDNADGLTLFGLESESISTQRLTAEVDTVVAPLIGQTEDLLQIYELKRLDQALKALILFKITHPDDQGEWNALQRKRHSIR
jgi:hypothetical protein